MVVRFLSGYRLAAAAISLSLALCAPGAHAWRGDSVPDWVKAAAAQPEGKYTPETSAVVLLNEITLSVEPDGKAVRHLRYAIKILRPDGRNEAMVVVPFDKAKKILSLHVWSIGPDGHEYAVKDSEFSEFGYGAGNLYEDERYKVVNAPGRDPGGIVAYEVEQRTEPFVNEATFFYQGDVPRLNQSFTLALPTGYTYRTTWAHHDAEKAIDLEHQRVRWVMPSTPGIDLDRVPLHPSLEALSGRMTVHYAAPGAGTAALGTWQEIGEWYDLLSRDRLVATPDIAAKAAELTAGKTDFYDKTEAIGEFVQTQIRYFAIEMGVGGYQPHAASDIFRNRYGDCKDKATLMSAMLSSVGIHSALMMVDHRRGVVDPLAPSIVGDHMIGAIEIPTGYDSPRMRSTVVAKSGRRYLIFDPTWEKTAFGQLEHNLQGGFGILMQGKDTEVIALPVLSPELNTVERTASFQLQPDGSLKGSVVEKRFGDLSEHLRELYVAGDEKEQRASMNSSLSQDFRSFTFSDVKVENAKSLNKSLTRKYDVSADRFGRNMGPLLMVRPRVLGTEGLMTDRKPRLLPVDLKETLQEKDDFTIELPTGYALDELPEPVTMDLGFAAYKSSSEVKGSSLHYTRTYTVRQLVLPPERYGDVQKLAAAIDADEQNHAVLKKK